MIECNLPKTTKTWLVFCQSAKFSTLPLARIVLFWFTYKLWFSVIAGQGWLVDCRFTESCYCLNCVLFESLVPPRLVLALSLLLAIIYLLLCLWTFIVFAFVLVFGLNQFCFIYHSVCIRNSIYIQNNFFSS